MAARPAKYSDESLIKATGKPWSEWLKVFKQMQAESMPHYDIACALEEKHGVPGWWAQSLTVQFEQAIGRREPGQRCTGEFHVGVSATLTGDKDDALALWKQFMKKRTALNGVSLESEPAISSSEKWRYWKVKLSDGTRVNVNFSDKTGDKTLIQIDHERLPAQDSLEPWRAFWKQEIQKLRESQ